MKKLAAIQIVLILITLSLYSCVQDSCSDSGDGSVSASSDSLQTSSDCSSDSSDDSGSVDDGDVSTDPDDDTSTPPVDSDPEETIEESFYSPWKKDWTAIVIDAYQGNSINWDKMATDKRMVGVIHRSSIGLRTDTKYLERKAIALARG